MDEDQLFANLPDDPGLAFVSLEKLYRDQHDEATRDTTENSVFSDSKMTYLNKVIAVAKYLDIPGIKDYELPESEKNLWEFSRVFGRDVESLVVQIRLANSKNFNLYSVALSPAEKEKARHFINQLDQLVDEANCSQDKKEAIRKKLSELRQEIEQDRTRFDRFTDKLRAMARLSGDIERDGAEPWFKWVKALLGVIDDAKENEPKTTLPAPQEKKRIEAPRKRIPDFNRSEKLDDEVPF